MFGLERERGRLLFSNALTFILLFVAIIGAVTYVNLEVRPTLPPELLRPPTPTPDPFTTPLSSPTPAGTEPPTRPPPTPPLVATVTLPGDSNNQLTLPTPGAGIPTAPPSESSTPSAVNIDFDVASSGCSSIANITQPPHGAQVTGEVGFYGTASGASFAFYKLEISGPQTDHIWASLLDGVVGQPVVGGLLGQVNLTAWQAGPYQVRLIVVDQTSNETAPCLIEIELTGG